MSLPLHQQGNTEVWQIRLATQDDVHGLATLCVQLGYPEKVGPIGDRLSHIMKLEHHVICVAASYHGSIWGWVHIFERPLIVQGLSAELGGLVVEQSVRQQGVGRALMLAAEKWARSRDLAQLTVRSNTNRIEAHEFYQALGYERQKTSYTFKKDFHTAG